MLDMNTLVAEILVGVGAAIFFGSLIAIFRQRTPSGLVTRHPSHRPRAVAEEQQIGTASPADADTENASDDTGDAAASQPVEAYRLRKTRTLFFMVTGFIVMLWGIATIVAQG